MKVFIPYNEKGAFDRYVSWIPKAKITTKPSDADLFLFAGGADIHPHLYGQKTNTKTHTNPPRDLAEIHYFRKAIENDIKMLGICRGAQFLTVMAGGNLLQHITGHSISHTTFLSNGQVIETLSTHHQMMNPYVLKKDHYKLIGVAEGIVDVFEDGTNCRIPIEEGFLEPEIVYYTKLDVLCIQGHPERQLHDDQADYLDAQKGILNDYLNNRMGNWHDYRKEANQKQNHQ